MNPRSILRAGTRLLVRLILLLALAGIAFTIGGPPSYDFPEPHPFQGSAWWNPYRDFTPENLRKCNTHAHAYCWWGIMSGSVPEDEVARMYQERGYDLAPVTSYQVFSKPLPGDAMYVTGYEHAIGMAQYHHSVIRAEHVCWFDYPFWQTLRNKQHVLDILREDAPFLTLNHPHKGFGYSRYELERLTGYHAIEVATKYSPDNADLWDDALSGGRPVWGVATDDGRRQRQKDSHIGIGWILVHGAERTVDSILEGMRQGRFHAVWNKEKERNGELLRCEVTEGDTLQVRLKEPVTSIQFIGQGGVLRQSDENTAQADYPLRDDDTYVRVEIRQGDSVVYLNPVFRYEPGTDPLAAPQPTRDAVMTFAWRTTGVMTFLIGAFFIWRLTRHRRHAVPATAS